MNEMKAWEKFDRFAHGLHLDFYGCVNADGDWFDSAELFETAVHWCCCEAGKFNMSTKDELKWMDDEGLKLGFSVIHATMIKKMYEHGLIK